MVEDRKRSFYKIGRTKAAKLTSKNKWATAIDFHRGQETGIKAIENLLGIDFYTDRGYFRRLEPFADEKKKSTELKGVTVLTLNRKLNEEELSAIHQANYDIEELSRDDYAKVIRSHRKRRDLCIKEEINVYGKRVSLLQLGSIQSNLSK